AQPAPGPRCNAPSRLSPCRVRSHTPSFCDESLFGARPEGPWAAPRGTKEDVARLHALLWSPPPPAPRSQRGLAPRAGETPLRPAPPPAPAAAGPEGGFEGKACAWQRPQGAVGPAGPGAPGRGWSQSLSRLNTPSGGLCLAAANPKTERGKNQSPPTAPATPRGPLLRGRLKSMSGPSLATSSKAAGGCKPRPPWK
ncbi:RITA1 protein, partial [Nyctibius bracteatus]|nr:RITA1 protein [Nyctibius bracteatus]